MNEIERRKRIDHLTRPLSEPPQVATTIGKGKRATGNHEAFAVADVCCKKCKHVTEFEVVREDEADAGLVLVERKPQTSKPFGFAQ